jgi:hypothetical protein
MGERREDEDATLLGSFRRDRLSLLLIVWLWYEAVYRGGIWLYLSVQTRWLFIVYPFLFASSLIVILGLLSLIQRFKRWVRDRIDWRVPETVWTVSSLVLVLVIVTWVVASFEFNPEAIQKYASFYLGGLLGVALVSALVAIVLPGGVFRRVPPTAVAAGFILLWAASLAYYVLPSVLATGAGESVSPTWRLGRPGDSGRFPATLRVILARAYDFDRDGLSPIDGTDCRDLDVAVNVLAREIPGNGHDDNCDGLIDEPEGTRNPSPAGGGEVRSPVVREAVARLREANRTRHVIFFSIDAARADHLSLNGYSRRTSPNLETLAKEAWNFPETYSPGTSTELTFTSLFHGREFLNVYPKLPNLGRILLENGFETHAVPARITKFTGPGADAFDFLHKANFGDPEDVLKRAFEVIDRMSQSGRRTFLWVHFFSITNPYPKRPAGEVYGSSRIDRYDHNISYHDHLLRRFQERLRERGLWDKSLLFFFSDHGEEFGEHGYFYHGQSVYSELTRVPFLVRIPGAAPVRVPGRTRLLDLTPTLLDALGIVPPNEFTGRSLLPRVFEKSNKWVATSFIQGWTDFGILDGPWYLVWRQGNWWELFRESKDPGHQRNLAREHPDVVESLIRKHLPRLKQHLAFLKSVSLPEDAGY